jgi:hypothetical protein
MATLETRILNILGDRTAAVLEKSFGITTVNELLRHYPRRYEVRGELTDISKLLADDEVTILAQIERVSLRRANGKNILEVIVTDGSANLSLTFFNQAWREKELKAGRVGLFAGKVGVFKGKRQLSHPDYQMVPDGDDVDAAVAEFAGKFLPVYPATAKLPSWKVMQCMKLVTDSLDEIADYLPNELIAKYPLDTALNRFENALNSPEKIFAFVSTGVGDNRASSYINNYRIVNPTNPPPNRLSKSLYLEATADSADRRSKFYAIFNAGTSSETYGIKKFNFEFLSNPISYTSQLVLMRAESLVKSGGQATQALADVNAIIERAYGNKNYNVPDGTNINDVLAMIRKQRRLEFPLEGIRTQDLKRIGALEDPTGSGFVTIRNSKWNCPGLALQFPVNENTSIFEFNPEGGCE